MTTSRLPIPPLNLFTTQARDSAQAGDVLSVVPFLSLARELSALLIPVRPSSEFRGDLERSLLVSARQLNAQAAMADFTSPATYSGVRFDTLERRWVIGAAAAAMVGSAVSIAGIVVYALHRRAERAA